MRGRGLTGLLVAVMAITCFLFDGQAVELSPTKPQRAIQPPIQTQPPTPQLTLLPDLVMERVWLDSQNHIVLIVKNTGKGSVSDESYAKGYVRVTYGNSQKDYALKIVDGAHWLFDFGAKESEARQALAIMKKYGFNRSCFVGRPHPSFKYLRK